ncbi:MAG: hypothetical protein ACXW3G_12825, partial [Rhodoplanes sp.]
MLPASTREEDKQGSDDHASASDRQGLATGSRHDRKEDQGGIGKADEACHRGMGQTAGDGALVIVFA